MTAVKNNSFKWSLDFIKRRQDKSTDSVNPPGYSQSAGLNGTELSKDSESSRLIVKKSWDLALGPLKQVPMNLFVMYMSGNSISIFPIMMIGMLVVRPIKSLFTLQTTFKTIEGTQSWGQKFIFFIGNCVNIVLALYKCQSMGLLPTHASDWLAFIDPPTKMEYSGGGFCIS